MITHNRDQSTYLLNEKLELRLQHCHFAYASNTQIIQKLKLIDRIKLTNLNIKNSNNNQFSSNLKVDHKERNKLNINNLIPFNKITKNIKDFCDIYIYNKYKDCKV